MKGRRGRGPVRRRRSWPELRATLAPAAVRHAQEGMIGRCSPPVATVCSERREPLPKENVLLVAQRGELVVARLLAENGITWGQPAAGPRIGGLRREDRPGISLAQVVVNVAGHEVPGRTLLVTRDCELSRGLSLVADRLVHLHGHALHIAQHHPKPVGRRIRPHHPHEPLERSTSSTAAVMPSIEAGTPSTAPSARSRIFVRCCFAPAGSQRSMFRCS